VLGSFIVGVSKKGIKIFSRPFITNNIYMKKI
jgi:hypothetical protein